MNGFYWVAGTVLMGVAFVVMLATIYRLAYGEWPKL